MFTVSTIIFLTSVLLTLPLILHYITTHISDIETYTSKHHFKILFFLCELLPLIIDSFNLNVIFKWALVIMIYKLYTKHTLEQI